MRETDTAEQYYIFNAHGDVTGLVNNSQTVEKTYDYDAFGNEKEPSATDANPFRYCGEYFDKETGTYYLRARYYDTSIGRFTQQDTHWNTANMIYGDTNNTGNPSLYSIMQSTNLYVYCINNPIIYFDSSGRVVEIMHYKNPGRKYGHVDININGKIYSYAAYGYPSITIIEEGSILVADKTDYILERYFNGDIITGFVIKTTQEQEENLQAVLDSYINGSEPYTLDDDYNGIYYLGKWYDNLAIYSAFDINCVRFTGTTLRKAHIYIWPLMPILNRKYIPLPCYVKEALMFSYETNNLDAPLCGSVVEVNNYVFQKSNVRLPNSTFLTSLHVL